MPLIFHFKCVARKLARHTMIAHVMRQRCDVHKRLPRIDQKGELRRLNGAVTMADPNRLPRDPLNGMQHGKARTIGLKRAD